MYLDKNLVMFLCQFLSAITDVEAGMCWVYLAGHKRALAWFADQEMLKYQEWSCGLCTSCIARPTNNSSWCWPWWPWWSWLALTAWKKYLRGQIKQKTSTSSHNLKIYISWALAALAGPKVEPHNCKKSSADRVVLSDREENCFSQHKTPTLIFLLHIV